MLQIRNVSKRFGGVTAVDGVSFDVPMGSIVALIGPNGAGKTTTFNLISGIAKPDNGEIRLFDRRISGLSASDICRTGVARTFQISQLFDAMTVEQNVLTAALFARGYEVTVAEARRRTDEVLEPLALSDKRSLFPKDLTFGQRRRVEIARALVMKPRVLLLDEVLAGLTAAEIDEAIELIERVRTPELGILLVEHQMRAVMRLANSVVVMAHGRVLASGSPSEIRRDPRVLAAYLGEEIDESGMHSLYSAPSSSRPDRPADHTAGAGRPMLEVEGLAAGYGPLLAIRGVSLCVRPNEVVALIGSNGMGKSTTLKAISGMLPLRGGKICFEGRELDRLPPHMIVRLGLGQVPEGRQLFQYMSVEDNLLLGAAFLPEAWRRRHETLAEVFRLFPRLAERRWQRAAQLSGGEQQMVAIGRALMGRPKLLMLDEPSIGLAPIVVAETFNAIAQIGSTGVSVLLVEQNVAWALRVAQRLYVMETGRIALESSAEELRRDGSFLQSFGLEKLH